VVGGLTVAAYLVPQVMAYATLAGLPPVTGLWAALPALVLYALLGTSRTVSVGPESTTALMTAAVVAPLAGGDPDRYATLAATLAMIVGVIGVAASLLRLGFVADLLSRPVLLGYLAGVAVAMIVGQLGRATGIRVEGHSLGPQLLSLGRQLPQAHLPTLALTLAVLGFLVAARRVLPSVPGPLLAVVLAAVAVAGLDLEARGIAVIGEVPTGLPVPIAPDPGEAAGLLLSAVGVLVVGYTDLVLTARAFADRAGEQIDATRELLALGVANLAAGALRGLPVSSSSSRTAIGKAAGATTQRHSLVAAAVVLLVLLVAAPGLALFPSAALAALVIYAAGRFIDVAGFRRLARFRRSELALAITATAGVLTFDVLYGIIVAVGLSVVDLLRRVARPHDAVLGFVPGVAGMHDVADYPEARTVPGLLVYRYDSPLFFANANDFAHRSLAALSEAEDPVAWFVLNMEANVEVDITGLDSVEELRNDLSRRGVVLALARVKQDLLRDLRAYGLADALGPDRIFPTLPTAVEAYHRWAAEHGPHPDPPDAGPGRRYR
jgi:high affinity sulfate transporter 1